MPSLIMPSLLITMVNNCGTGETILTNMSNLASPVNVNLATGSTSYLATGSLLANAYFDNGSCAEGGGNCSTVAITFNNGTTDVAIAVLPPYGFSAPFGFSYYSGGCHTGFWCPDTTCLENGPPAVECTVDGETGLVVLFCPSGAQPSSSASSGPDSSSTPAPGSALSHSNVHPGPIIAGIISGVVAIVILIALFVFLAKRRKNSFSGSREKFEFRTRPWAKFKTGAKGNIRNDATNQPDPFHDPTPRSGSPAGWSVAEEMPVKVVYSDTSMPFKDPAPIKV
jgi:hypothetical protein